MFQIKLEKFAAVHGLTILHWNNMLQYLRNVLQYSEAICCRWEQCAAVLLQIILRWEQWLVLARSSPRNSGPAGPQSNIEIRVTKWKSVQLGLGTISRLWLQFTIYKILDKYFAEKYFCSSVDKESGDYPNWILTHILKMDSCCLK